MNFEFTTTGRIEGGKLKIRNAKTLAEVIASWPEIEVVVTVEKAHAHRSDAANRYYWGVVVSYLSEYTGYSPEETHEALKTMFLPKKLAMLGQNGEVNGELVIGGSTTKLNKIEFGDYVSRIREWARDTLGVEIPSPTDRESEA